MKAISFYLDIIRSNEMLQDIIIDVFLLFIIILFFTSFASVFRFQADELERLQNRYVDTLDKGKTEEKKDGEKDEK